MAKELTKEQKAKLLRKWFITEYLPWYQRQQDRKSGVIPALLPGDDDPPPPPPKKLP
jgi:hypothetical protein